MVALSVEPWPGFCLEKGVIAGGVLLDGLIATQTSGAIRSVFAPKVNGLENLMSSSQARSVQSVIAFSSVAVLMGSAGQGGYAAANSAMEAILELAQIAGSPGTRLPTSP